MKQEEIDEIYMRRCLQLARNGQELAKPNPMVGAVIVSQAGQIIGEGYHVRCGEAHAEVNAFASVRTEDEPLLPESTVYVSLEPCSHYGKTPPCADLIVGKGVKRVVCGCVDPFPEVKGRGIRRIREAGIEVTVGVLEKECLELNRKFITFNTLKRPYIILKWAQTENRIIGNSSTILPNDEGSRTQANPSHCQNVPTSSLQISTPFTKMLVHKLRAENDAILVGRVTDELEHPQLNVREWSGPNPCKCVLSSTIPVRSASPGTLSFTGICPLLSYLYEHKLQSLIVEGGAQTLQSFIDEGLWDEIRIETAPFIADEGIGSPRLPTNSRLVKTEYYENCIATYRRLTE